MIRFYSARPWLFPGGKYRVTWSSLLKTQSFKKRALKDFCSIPLTTRPKPFEFIL